MAESLTSSFPAAALEINRAGTLSDEQRTTLTAYVRHSRGNDPVLAAAAAILGLVLLTTAGAAGIPWIAPFGVAAFVVAAGLVLGWAGVFSPVLRDVRAGRVESAEGALRKEHHWVSPASRANTYYLDVGGRRLVTTRASYEALPDAGIFRLYYVPRSRRVVNVERLPDRPLPPDALDSPAALVQTHAQDFRSGGAAEAQPRLAALQARLSPESSAATAPHAPEERDPRPLAQAILGSWRGGAFSLVFTPDGAVTVSFPTGRQIHGRWSVDLAGRLRTVTTGEEKAEEAWVVEDALNLVTEGRTLVFRRA